MLAAVAVALLVGAGADGGHDRPDQSRGTAVRPVASALPGTSGGPALSLGARISALHPLDALGNAEIKRLVALGLPIFCGGLRGNEVAFTFDDGPGVYTHYAIKKLTQAHERATFFIVGRLIALWPGWLQQELKLGAIGDHTWTHPELIELTPSEIRSQLSMTAQAIHAVTGQDVDMWRPPYELHNAITDRIAQRLGLLEILWSVDSGDSVGANWALIIREVEAELKPGMIILFHENRGQTIRALTTLLPDLRRGHLRSVSVPELLATDPPSLRQLREGINGCDTGGKQLQLPIPGLGPAAGSGG
ncbi:MAG: polysaccharide deacetylase family protein [Solirubrobacteraceae bacterium]